MQSTMFRKITTATLTLAATAAFGLGTSSEAWGRTSAWDGAGTDKTSAWDGAGTDKTSAWD